MAVLDDRFERACEHLREELELFRLTNDRFTEIDLVSVRLFCSFYLWS